MQETIILINQFGQAVAALAVAAAACIGLWKVLPWAKCAAARSETARWTENLDAVHALADRVVSATEQGVPAGTPGVAKKSLAIKAMLELLPASWQVTLQHIDTAIEGAVYAMNTYDLGGPLDPPPSAPAAPEAPTPDPAANTEPNLSAADLVTMAPQLAAALSKLPPDPGVS